MRFLALSGRDRTALARAVANHQYERSPSGILFPKQNLMIAGVFESAVNDDNWELDANIIPTEGLNHILDVIIANGSQIGTWYVAPFEGNVTPDLTYTAANFTATATESTAYSEANRVTYVPGAAVAGSIDNDASRAEFTITATKTLYGAALLSAQAKSATTGKILACSKFGTARSVVSGDTLQVKYTLTVAN